MLGERRLGDADDGGGVAKSGGRAHATVLLDAASGRWAPVPGLPLETHVSADLTGCQMLGTIGAGRPAVTAPALGARSQLLIGGKWVEASGGTYEIVNPATEEAGRPAPDATVADAEAAAAAAKEALPAVGGDSSRRALCPDGRGRPGHQGAGRGPASAGHRRDRRHRRGGIDACRCPSQQTASSATRSDLRHVAAALPCSSGGHGHATRPRRAR